MIIAGRQLRIFDPWVLLCGSIPLAIAIAHMPPLLPYAGSPHSRGTFGFPFAFGETWGASSWENIISAAPMALDIALLLVLFHAAGLGLNTVLPQRAFRIALGVVGLLGWLAVLTCYAFTWNYTWALNWWSLGSPDYYIG